MKKILIISLLLCSAVFVYSQSGIQDLYSPMFLGQGENSADTFSPQSDTLNPAASGGRQNPAIDVSYISLSGFGSTSGFGHGVNLGVSIPSGIGVFTGSGRFITSPLAGAYQDTFGTFNASFAKDLYRNLLFGFGIQSQFGSDWGLGLDLGIIHHYGPLIKKDTPLLQDFSWGFAFRGIGKGYKPDPAGLSSPTIFTPAIGASLTLLDTKPVKITFMPDVSFPAFQDIRTTAGLSISLFDIVSVNSAYTFDLRDYNSGSSRPFPVSFGVTTSFNPFAKEKEARFTEAAEEGREGMAVNIAAANLAQDVWAFGLGSTLFLGFYDRNPPKIEMGPTEPYISPNYDGTLDELTIPVTITDERYISGYQLTVYDDNGEAVRTIRNKEERPENETFQNIVQRFAAKKAGIPVPETLRWDGNSDSGTVVPDGDYTFVLESWDDNENVAAAPERKITVDTAYPEIKVTTPYTVFSPNGDGRQDLLILQHTGSKEDLWKGTVLDSSDTAVKTFTWKDSKPDEISWDGKNEEGILPPDGVYHYTVASTDKAGNSTSLSLENIIINTTPTPITIAIEYPEFSPNGDGVQDTLAFSPDVPVTEGITEWSLEISSPDSEAGRIITGGSEVPDTIIFDGKSNEGTMLPERSYQAVFSVLYENGNLPKAEVPSIIVDVTAPKLGVSPEYPVFSPNGDGSKDTFPLSQDTSEEPRWKGTVSDSGGTAVFTVEWQGKADPQYAWDGRNSDGEVLPDGEYTYQLSATDAAGNSSVSEPVSVILDTTETPIRLTAGRDYFSPNSDGVWDTMPFALFAAVQEGIETYSLTVRTEEGKAVTSYSGRKILPSDVSWDGKTDTGSSAPDGTYFAELSVEYINGNKPLVKTGLFTIDSVFPSVSLSSVDPVFSPDGDGRQDSLSIRQQTSEEDLWEGSFLDSSGEKVRTLFWKGRADNFAWDGKDDNGNKVTDGRYSYILTSRDRAGNAAQAKTASFRIDTKPTPVSLAVASKAFSPNRDGVLDELIFKTDVQEKTGITSWTLEVRNTSGNVVREITGRDTVPGEIVFNGRNAGGALLREGTYTGTLSVIYEKGANPKADSPGFQLDLTPPSVDISLSTEVFSPNGDNRKDEVFFLHTASTEEEWKASITNDEGETVKTVQWKGTPDKEYSWNGRTDDGALVPDGKYFYRIASTDLGGNETVSPRIPVIIDTQETPVTLTYKPQYFSPNGDGKNESITVNVTPGRNDGISRYAFAVVDASGKKIWEKDGSGRIPGSFVWRGETASSGKAPDGEYHAEVSIEYENGNFPEARTSSFFLDTKVPEVAITYDFLLFSPDGDGNKDNLVLRQRSSEEETWEAKIKDASGKTRKTVFWKGKTSTFSWDGRDENGNKVADGTYQYELFCTDRAGNFTQETIRNIKIDTRNTLVYLTASETEFSPNRDGKQDTITLTPYLSLTDGISSWSLKMVHDSSFVPKEFNGTGVPPKSFIWDGSGTRRAGEDGSYTAVFEVIYEKGNRPKAEAEFTLDTSPPNVRLSLFPQPFSPDNDGVDDELNIDISVNDVSKIKGWQIEIFDPVGSVFTSYSGKGEPSSRIIWEGISDRGELVQSAEDYTLRMTIEDELGNISVTEEIIPVDVLVIREGNRLKVIISSIIFAPNTSDYEGVEEEKALKNMKTLRRLAEIFKKYNRYRILIEGHAVMINWNDPVKGQKEQEEELIPLSKDRAEAVKNALVQLGIDKNRITTEGIGGAKPIVPHSDLENRWKNRRVEFILVK